MRVVVLGAGIIGVTTAWTLSAAGHDVVVIDRHDSAAQETSFANGGQLSVSHAAPWANPAAPLKILQSIGREDAPLLWRMRADPTQWQWGARFLLECLPHRAQKNVRSLLALGLYSQAALTALHQEISFDFHYLQRGILHFFTDHSEFTQARLLLKGSSQHGANLQTMSAAECLAIEPALHQSIYPVVGGIYAPDDGSGDARLFCEELTQACLRRGVKLMFGVAVNGLARQNGKINSVLLEKGEPVQADAFVVALGCQSLQLLRTVGLSFPIYPLKGYSASIEIPSGTLAPCVSLTDERHKLVFSRLGNTLRVAGTAEFNGYDTHLNRERCDALVRRTRQIFPDLSKLDDIQFWTGLRPATPSNVPFVGATEISNLWVNSGHGTLGWTLACGSAKLLAQLIDGTSPGLDPAPYCPQRGN
jgi:D-amino-acid dehydrogenase